MPISFIFSHSENFVQLSFEQLDALVDPFWHLRIRADTAATAHLKVDFGLLSRIMTAGMFSFYKFEFCSAVAYK